VNPEYIVLKVIMFLMFLKVEIIEALLFSQSVVSLHNTETTLNGEADPKSVHRTIESVYIKKENVESDTDEEVRIFLKQNV
jgi:hypothetical protein